MFSLNQPFHLNRVFKAPRRGSFLMFSEILQSFPQKLKLHIEVSILLISPVKIHSNHAITKYKQTWNPRGPYYLDPILYRCWSSAVKRRCLGLQIINVNAALFLMLINSIHIIISMLCMVHCEALIIVHLYNTMTGTQLWYCLSIKRSSDISYRKWLLLLGIKNYVTFVTDGQRWVRRHDERVIN